MMGRCSLVKVSACLIRNSFWKDIELLAIRLDCQYILILSAGTARNNSTMCAMILDNYKLSINSLLTSAIVVGEI